MSYSPKKIICTCLITALLVLNLLQSPQQASASVNHGLGVTAGLLSGLGFAYRYQTENLNAHHISVIFYGSSQDLFTSLAYQYSANIKTFGASSIAWIVGVSDFYRQYHSSSCDVMPGENKEPCSTLVSKRYYTNKLNLGAGLGFQYGNTQGLSIILELPLTISIDFQNERLTSNNWSILPVPSITLLYWL